jgi:tetratricopeptide (TPR) repeat protein
MSDDLTHTGESAGVTIAKRTAPSASPTGYDLHEEIGRGGMGVVYRASDVALGREVAVKLLADRYPPDSLAAVRFLNEARITGQLQHPGIPAVHQVGALADGRPFLVMKLIKGSTLEAILKQRTCPEAERGRLLAVFEAICQAVGYAHAHRVIHRDLKPANVMVGAFGEVQVMDWGLAKVLGEEPPETAGAQAPQHTRAWTEVSPTPESGSQTQEGSLVGTPSFIPPEQAVGEIGRVNERSDVFGLGALLAVILTGQPPYVGETFESVRVLAIRGRLDSCFTRLDESKAEPELIALCKQCLAFEPAHRPPDGGAVAQAVAALRAAADDRARRAELERVRIEGEKATVEARSAERRKRRRLVIGAATVMAVAAVGGLTAVLAVQRQANADLAAKNGELADERAKVQARFELALKAIATFHTGVSKDVLLKNAQLRELRTKLLKEAAEFYSDLQKLLEGQTDIRSRKALAAGSFQLGQLTEKIGSKPEALATQRKALAGRRELATAPGADVETRLDLARSLWAVGDLLLDTGDKEGARRAYDEQRDISTALEVESPTDAVRAILARSYANIGVLLWRTRKLAEALDAQGKALAIREKLADANPAATQFQTDLAGSHSNIAILLSQTGKPAEALVAYRKALAIRQKLADANPAITEFQGDLARICFNIGYLLNETGRQAEALEAHKQGLEIRQKLADAIPAVTQFQSDLADSHDAVGRALSQTGKPADALEAYRQALAIRQKLADANPAITEFQGDLASSLNSMGELLRKTGKPAEALMAHRQALAIGQKLADANPADSQVESSVAYSHYLIGAALSQTGKPAEASFRRAVEIMERLPTLTPADHYNQACYYARLADAAVETGSGMTAADRLAAADKAIKALRLAIAAGYNNDADLSKDSDLDGLRSRTDFKKLMEELQKRSSAKPKEP